MGPRRRFIKVWILSFVIALTFGYVNHWTKANAVEIPALVEANRIGFYVGNPDAKETIATSAKLGAGWVKPHPGPFAWQWIEPEKGVFDFSRTDWWVRETQAHQIAILGTIWPYADWEQKRCHGVECEVAKKDPFYPRVMEGGLRIDGIPISRCTPCNLDDYQEFLTKLIERYDGDGLDDMPGLKIPIRYWEIMNEPEMKFDFLTFYKGTEEEYVQILQASYDAIKSACSDCIVLQGGIAGIEPFKLAYWSRVFDLGGGDFFDIANCHFVGGTDLSTLNVKAFKQLLVEKGIHKPIWVTEAGYKGWEADDDIIRSVNGAFKAGASKVFFTSFKIRGKGKPGEYSKVFEGIVGEFKCPVDPRDKLLTQWGTIKLSRR